MDRLRIWATVIANKYFGSIEGKNALNIGETVSFSGRTVLKIISMLRPIKRNKGRTSFDWHSAHPL